jgi:hypothetical protein
MPHRGPVKGFGKRLRASVRLTFAHKPAGDPAIMMITKKDFVDFGSGALVAISGGLAGHYAALGMTPVQWAGAACAVLGSVTIAVAVRVWPQPATARRQED